MLVVAVQGLGRMDAKLVFERLDPPPEHAPDHEHFENVNRFNEHITLSYLWVLGAYEVVRTLDQRAREQDLYGEAARARIRALKERFNRIRVPLAKLEADKRHSETDFAFAWPVLDDAQGIGWRVAPDHSVTRRELAEALLEVLESLS